MDFGIVTAKVDALLCHRSQWISTMGIDEAGEGCLACLALAVSAQLLCGRRPEGDDPLGIDTRPSPRRPSPRR